MRLATRLTAAALFFAAATAVLTYPLLWRAWDTVPFRIDPLFITWTLDWEQHILLSHPLSFFDANIFRPYHGTLAYSDLVLPDLLVFAPVEWWSGNPILAFNLTLFSAIAASGWCCYLLARRLTGSDLPALGAGILFAFCQYRWGEYLHLQMMSAFWIPLTILFLDRFIEKQRWRDALLAPCCLVLQALTTFYLGLFLGVEASLYVLFAQTRRKWLPRTAWLKLAFSLSLAGMLMVPLTVPFFRTASELGLIRYLKDAANGGAALSAFLRPAPHDLLYQRLFHLDRLVPAVSETIREETFFPGIIALTLGATGAVAAWRGSGWKHATLCLVAAVSCLGPFLLIRADHPTKLPLPYLLLYWLVPGFQSLRLPSRLAIFAFFWLGLLVASGLKWLLERRAALALAALALLLLENVALPRPALRVPVGNAIPPVYHWLAGQPQGTVVELPIAPSRYDESTYERLALYEYYAIFHRHASVNGYSSFSPPLYFELIDRMLSFPDRRSVSFLRGEDVRYVIVHNADLTSQEADRIRREMANMPLDLSLAGHWGSDDAYLLRPASTPTVLPQATVALPSSAVSGQSFRAVLQLEEPSEAAFLWAKPASLVLDVRWSQEATSGGAPALVARSEVSLPLAAEQGVTDVGIDLTAPPEPGRYQLQLRSAGSPLPVEVSQAVMVSHASTPASAPFRLRGVSFDRRNYAPGDVLFASLKWTGWSAQPLIEFLRVVDSSGWRGATIDENAFQGLLTPDKWPGGGSVTEVRGLPLPLDLPPGRYSVQIGWYDSNEKPIKVFAPDGRQVDVVEAGDVDIGEAGPTPFLPALLGLPGNGIDGALLVPRNGNITAGQPLTALLFLTPTDLSPKLSFQLRDRAGLVAAEASATTPPPLPSLRLGWTVREAMRIESTGPLRGDYEAELVTGQSVVVIGQVHVDSPAVSAESAVLPALEHPLHALFSGGIELVGYGLQPGQLRLYWHPNQPLAQSLKVFIHVLDKSGRILSQADSLPVGGMLPTTDWQPGSYVSDVHQLPQLPAAASSIEIGLYDGDSGVRWSLLSGGDPTANRVVIPIS